MEQSVVDVSDSTSADLYEQAADFYQHGHYEEATIVFQALASADSDVPHYWFALGSCLQMQNLYNEALASYAVAALLDESDPNVHYHAAECLFSLEHKQEGLSALNSAELAAMGQEGYKHLLERIAWLKARWAPALV